MSRATRSWAMAVIVAGVPVSGRAAEVNRPQPLTVDLLVIDQVGVAPKVLARAEVEATRIYQEAGIKLVWTDGSRTGAALQFSVKIVGIALKEADARAMGLAVGTPAVRGTLAYVFYSRLHDFGVSYSIDVGVILGHVIAHELGHLLLPHNAHSKTGIMAASFDQMHGVRAAWGLLAFSAAESQLMRAGLAARKTSDESAGH